MGIKTTTASLNQQIDLQGNKNILITPASKYWLVYELSYFKGINLFIKATTRIKVIKLCYSLNKVFSSLSIIISRFFHLVHRLFQCCAPSYDNQGCSAGWRVYSGIHYDYIPSAYQIKL